ncbi:MAG: SPFH domain-containing protein [Corynebacterium sp.]|uniref:SPFH domain-containing protein n=1 Tax=Corynebacterium sp. TaxID=1720 RepID=UPI003F93811E
MGFLRSRRNTSGASFYMPLSNATGWQPCTLRSPVALPGHAVLRQREGRIERLDARAVARPGDRFRQVDRRRRLITVHPQTVPTSDALPVTLTLAMSVHTVDPVTYVSAAQGPDEEIYLAAQIALRELVATLPLEDFAGSRIDLSPVQDALGDTAASVGVAVDSVLLKDVSLPAEYSSALQDAVVSKVLAENDLERARNEVKTTRARLASAKVLEQNPVLARIRMLEALPQGSTIEVRPDQV